MAAFAATANAFVGRRDNCCFHLTSSGGLSGDLGQLDDGQVRIGDNSLTASSFCMDANGAITDGAGRGCIVTAETTQFQCDEGATGTSGFSVDSSGKLEFNGNQDFIACQTGQNDGRNVYTTNSTSVTQCTNVQLTADSCSGSSGSGSGSSSAVVSPSAGASATPAPSSVPAVPGSEAPTGAPSGGPGGSGAPGGSGESTPVVPGGSGESTAPAGSGQSTPVAPGGSGSGESTAPAGAGESSAPAGTPLPGSPSTVVSTVTVHDCSCSASGGPGGSGGSSPGGGGSVPGGSSVPGTPGMSSVPGSPSGMTSVPSVAPSVPASSGGSQPSGPAGGGGSAHPSGPASGSSIPSVPVSSAATPSGSGSKPSDSASVPAGSASSSSTPSSTSASSSCPTDLSGDYEFPHLIVAVDSSSPDKTAGTGFNGTITKSVSSAFNFDIPSSDSGKTCSLVFLFPKLEDLETSSYSFSGDGKIDFAKLSNPVSSSTNAKNLPSVAQDLGEITVSPGNSYVVSTFSCPAGESVAYEMKNAGSTDLNFFEDWNPSPLGLYITVC